MTDFKLAGIVSAVGLGLGYLLGGRSSKVMGAEGKPTLTPKQIEVLNEMKTNYNGYSYVKVDNKGWDGYKPRFVQALLDKKIISIPKDKNNRFNGTVEHHKAYTVEINPVALEYPYKEPKGFEHYGGALRGTDEFAEYMAKQQKQPSKNPSSVKGDYAITYLESHNDVKNQHKYYLLLTSGQNNYTAYGRLPGYGREATMKLDKQSSASKMKELAMKKMKTYQLVGHKYDQIPSEIRAKLENEIGMKSSSPSAEPKQEEKDPYAGMNARQRIFMERRQKKAAETFEAEGKVGKNKWLQAIYDAIYDKNDPSYKIMYHEHGQYGYPILTSASLIEISMTQKALANGKKPPTERQVKNGMLKAINEASGQKLNPKGAKNYGATTKASYEYNGKRFFVDYTVNKPLKGDKEPYTLEINGEEFFENPMLNISKDDALRSYEAETFEAEGLNFPTNCLNCGGKLQVMEKKDHVKLVCYDCSDYIKLPKSHLSDSNKRELIMIQEGFEENEDNESFHKKYPHGMMAEGKVGNEMLRQLGGRRFMMMVGAKQPIWNGDKNELGMKIGRNAIGANYFTIRLNPKDLYDLRFESRRMNRKTYEMSVKVKAEHNDVYADQLQEIFENTTGLYTRMAESFEAESEPKEPKVKIEKRKGMGAEDKMSFDEKIKHLASYYGVGGLYIKRKYKKGQKLEEMLDDLGIPKGMVQESRIKDEAIHQNKYKYLGVSDWNSSERVVKAFIEQLRKEGKIISTRCEICKDQFPPMFLFKKIAPKTGEEIKVCKGCKRFFGADQALLLDEEDDGELMAAEYQPDQEIGDYSVSEIAKSSAIEGYQPNKYSFGPIGYGAESISSLKLKKDSCCCGATKKTPCVCMILGSDCSAKKPMCACYRLKGIQQRDEKGAETFNADGESTDSIPKPNPADKEEAFAWIMREHPHIKTDADREMEGVDYAAMTYHPEELEAGAINALKAGDFEAAERFVKALNRQNFIKAFQAEKNR